MVGPDRGVPCELSRTISLRRSFDEEAGLREEAEEHGKQDRELPQPSLDASPAAIYGRVAAERRGEARATSLHQDGQHQEDAEQILAKGKRGVHGLQQPRSSFAGKRTGAW